jgi:hypothetical protein
MRVADSTTERLREFREQLEQQFGPVPGSGDGEAEGMGGLDIFSTALGMEITKEEQEIRKKWAEVIRKLVASGGCDATTLLMVMTESVTDIKGRQLAEALKMCSVRQEAHQKFLAESGFAEGGASKSGAELFQAQAEQQSFMMDTQMAIQAIQSIKKDIDSFQNLAKSSAGAIHMTLQSMIRNIRVGG